MSSILAFEASADSCSVSLSFSISEVKTLKSDQPRSHSANLLPFCETLLNEAGVSLNSIDAIACAVGPGSFTGLRIALSIAQGLAYALDKPLIPVNSLAAMAITSSNPLAEVVMPIMDARMGEIYWGVYRPDGVAVSSDSVAILGTSSNFSQDLNVYGKLNNIYALGCNLNKIDFANRELKSRNIETIESCLLDSSHVIRLARRQFASGENSDPRTVDLCYCRNSVAWNKRIRIRS